MQAVILAAGSGNRLTEVSGGVPKCLLPIGGRHLIEHQLEALADAGIGRVLVVVGYKADEVRKTLGNRVLYVENKRYAETNSMYSLWLTREWVTGPFVLLNCDLLFHSDILSRILSKGGNALAFDSSSSLGQEQTKVSVRDGNVIDLGKDISPELSRGESLGLITFDEEGSRLLYARVTALVENGGERSWALEAIRSLCATVSIRGINVAGQPWVEIDYPYDLNRANEEVWPAIHKSRWQKVLRWRRTKWFAAALMALLLTGAGWMISSRFSPPSIAWTTTQPSSGTEVIVTLPLGDQRWWTTSSTEPLKSMIHGPSPVRAEFRLPITAGETVGEYVVEVSLDGTPFHWKVFKATPDPEARIDGVVVGDRDRFEFNVPDGDHDVTVRLLAGAADRLLVRFRIPEPETSYEEDDE